MSDRPVNEQGTVCTFNVSGLRMSEPCPRCGHMGMAHPCGNNRITHCLLCELEQVIASRRDE
jgi:hypothetical protein